jgi:hypothetical protein
MDINPYSNIMGINDPIGSVRHKPTWGNLSNLVGFSLKDIEGNNAKIYRKGIEKNNYIIISHNQFEGVYKIVDVYIRPNSLYSSGVVFVKKTSNMPISSGQVVWPNGYISLLDLSSYDTEISAIKNKISTKQSEIKEIDRQLSLLNFSNLDSAPYYTDTGAHTSTPPTIPDSTSSSISLLPSYIVDDERSLDVSPESLEGAIYDSSYDVGSGIIREGSETTIIDTKIDTSYEQRAALESEKLSLSGDIKILQNNLTRLQTQKSNIINIARSQAIDQGKAEIERLNKLKQLNTQIIQSKNNALALQLQLETERASYQQLQQDLIKLQQDLKLAAELEEAKRQAEFLQDEAERDKLAAEQRAIEAEQRRLELASLLEQASIERNKLAIESARSLEYERKLREQAEITFQQQWDAAEAAASAERKRLADEAELARIAQREEMLDIQASLEEQLEQSQILLQQKQDLLFSAQQASIELEEANQISLEKANEVAALKLEVEMAASKVESDKILEKLTIAEEDRQFQLMLNAQLEIKAAEERAALMAENEALQAKIIEQKNIELENIGSRIESKTIELGIMPDELEEMKDDISKSLEIERELRETKESISIKNPVWPKVLGAIALIFIYYLIKKKIKK